MDESSRLKNNNKLLGGCRSTGGALIGCTDSTRWFTWETPEGIIGWALVVIRMLIRPWQHSNSNPCKLSMSKLYKKRICLYSSYLYWLSRRVRKCTLVHGAKWSGAKFLAHTNHLMPQFPSLATNRHFEYHKAITHFQRSPCYLYYAEGYFNFSKIWFFAETEIKANLIRID